MATADMSTKWTVSTLAAVLLVAAAGCDTGRGIDEDALHFNNQSGQPVVVRYSDGSFEQEYEYGGGANLPVDGEDCRDSDIEIVDPETDRVLLVRGGPLCPGIWELLRNDLPSQ